MNATITAPAPRVGTRRTSATALLPAAGLVYVGAWLSGLMVAPASPKQTDSAASIHHYYAAHSGAIAFQSLLVHGVAGVALLVMAIGMSRYFSADAGLARWVRGTGVAAASVSFVQVAFAGFATYDADGTSASTIKSLFSAINYADTAKLALIAAFAATVTYAADRAGIFSRWLHVTGRALPVLLVAGGLTFIIDNAILGAALELSLLVLLIWAGASSWKIGRAARR